MNEHNEKCKIFRLYRILCVLQILGKVRHVWLGAIWKTSAISTTLFYVAITIFKRTSQLSFIDSRNSILFFYQRTKHPGHFSFHETKLEQLSIKARKDKAQRGLKIDLRAIYADAADANRSFYASAFSLLIFFSRSKQDNDRKGECRWLRKRRCPI